MNSIRLKPGDVSGLILLAGVMWDDKQFRDIAIYEDWIEMGSLYSSFKGSAKHTADTIIAIHDKDVKTLKRKRRWCEAAWAFIKDSYYRRDSSTSADWREETWPKFQKLQRVVKPFLPDRELI